ncbi:Aspartyl/glutamyl-tRNA(Asn/Gln) amidotransferase, C subunit [Oopsacas minuta]|uniref:Aspartyl/glutamyl-tRNA(Asn/Gln) amidotransferase, C subunit n=1 Tax=Oopsacas minuta TaxID=111878 RepID=A0AAV7JK80_9METZ|nr:Aspartyl/glutamyl-tRNA(Asn/Gln) amidotransferase, C subunit [Oopsacas minuta]
MLLSSIRKLCVASLCRFESTTPNEKERQMVKHLQKLSLLRENNNSERWTTDDELQAMYIRNGIEFCNRLFEIDLSDVEPLYQLNENRSIVMRGDFEREIPTKTEVMSNSPRKNDNYFIAPPIPATLVRIETGTKDKN